jgi:ribosome-associated translation inhibitor RaiA
MIHFEAKFFQKQTFTPEQIQQFLDNAKRDLNIAKQADIAEVKFSYSYNALIKSGIALIAKTGKVKIKSAQGHHFKLIEKMSQILRYKTIKEIGNAMRTKRNLDFYGGGIIISEKESTDYYNFVEKIVGKVERII